MTQLHLPNNTNIQKTVLLHEDSVMLASMAFFAMELGLLPASTADSHTVRMLSYLGLSYPGLSYPGLSYLGLSYLGLSYLGLSVLL